MTRFLLNPWVIAAELYTLWEAFRLFAPAPALAEPQLALLGLIAGLLITTALQVLLAPKPELENAKAASLEDFDFPTASEARKIPVVWGTVRLNAPNVIWYGDLTSTRIRQKVQTGLLSSRKITVAIEYSFGMDLGLCLGPVDYISNILIGERSIPDFEAGVVPTSNGAAVAIDEPSFFGGRRQGGRLKGTVRCYSGAKTQTRNDYLVTTLAPTTVPAYNNVCRLVWEGGVHGETEQIPPWNVQVSRYPNTLGVTGGKEAVGTGLAWQKDANPACVLWELLTENGLFGLAIPEFKLDKQSFLDAADTLFNEGNGISWVLNNQTSSIQVRDTILEQMDAVLGLSPDGTRFLKLLRDDYAIGTVPVLDASNSKCTEFGRASWFQTQNWVSVDYQDRDKEFQSTSAVATDLANQEMQGRRVQATVTFPGLKDKELAAALSARELNERSFPLVTVALEVTREGLWDTNLNRYVQSGDVVVWTGDIGNQTVTQLPVRVLEVDYGALIDGSATLKGIQDLYGLEQTIIEAPPPSEFVLPNGEPTDITTADVLELPYWFILIEPAITDKTGAWPALLAQRAGAVDAAFEGWYDIDRPNDAFELLGESETFTPSALVAIEYPALTDAIDATGIVIKELTDESIVEALENQSSDAEVAQFGRHMVLVNDEVIAYETITDNGDQSWTLNNCHRAMLDTVPATHAVNDRLWFFTLGNVVGDNSFGDTSTQDFRFAAVAPDGTIDVNAAATEVTKTFTDRLDRPLRPGNFRVNGSRVLTDVESDDVDVEWNHRNRDTLLLQDDNEGDSADGRPSAVEYTARWYKQGEGSPFFTNSALTGKISSRTRAQLLSGFGGSIGASDQLRVELDTNDTGASLLAHQNYSRIVDLWPGSDTVSTESATLAAASLAESDDDMATILGTTSATSWSVSFWLKLNTLTNQGWIMQIGAFSDSDDQWEIVHLLESGDYRLKLRYNPSVGSPTDVVEFEVPDTDWHHYTIEWDLGSSISMYVDGTLEDSDTVLTGLPTNEDFTSRNWYIGYDFATTTLVCEIDEIAWYDRVLNVEDRRYLGNWDDGGPTATIGAPDLTDANAPTGLVVNLLMGEDPGDDGTAPGALIDQSGNGYDLTVDGDITFTSDVP